MDKQEKKKAIISAISKAIEELPSPVITRDLVVKLTGGTISRGYLANLDSQGLGIPGSFKIGQKKCYLKDNFLKWIEERMQV